jgi:hypothetical protein
MSFRVTLTALDRCLAVAALCPNFEQCHNAICDPRINWSTLIGSANRYLVAPALWTAVVQTEALQQVPENARSYLALLYYRNAYRNVRIRQQCVELGAILMRGGIRAVLLKGVAWLSTVAWHRHLIE